MDHLGPTLSAYLDGALEPAERAAAESHLAGCASCRRQLAELGATAHLIASVAAALPSRSLVPRLAVVPAWARPVRSLATLTSGLFVLVFIASAALATGLGGGGKGSLLGPLSGSGTSAAQAAPPNVRAAAPSPAPAAASFGFAPQVTAVSPQPDKQLQDAARTGSGPSGPAGAGSSSGPTGPAAAAGAASPGPSFSVTYTPAEPASAQLGPTPLLWLALALASALIAYVAHRRAKAA